jgi:hypothetical protein
MIVTGAAAAAFAAAPTAVLTFATDGPTVQNQADPCYNGVIPWNPYIQSCTLPGPTNKIRGSAPDANAIIACRNHPGCLPYYINNP